MRRLLLISLLLAMPSYLAAQRMGFARSSGRSSFGQSGSFAGHSRASYYPAFLDPYSYYLSNSDYAQSPQPPVIFLQPAQAALAPEPPSPMPPLLIELQGNSYVRISGDEPSQAQLLDQPRVSEPARSASVSPPPQPTVLVFRDGHRLEVSDYTIADGFLYASSDYYRSGSWNQQIDLASLDLDETVSSNRSRGLTFRLPSAPNIVIVGS